MSRDLLQMIVDAHGGMTRWHAFSRVQATIVTGGQLWGMKGLVQDANPRQMTVWLHEQRASITPFGAADQRTAFTASRIAIEKLDGTLVAERDDPRSSFDGHSERSRWDPLQRAYFNGYALWLYLTTPFVLAMSGVSVREVDPHTEHDETWRVLRAEFPPSIATHSGVQDFFFDDTYLLRRHDYSVDIAGGFPAAQLVSEYREANGIRYPSRRRAYRRDEKRRPDVNAELVTIDLSDVAFS